MSWFSICISVSTKVSVCRNINEPKHYESIKVQIESQALCKLVYIFLITMVISYQHYHAHVTDNVEQHTYQFILPQF